MSFSRRRFLALGATGAAAALGVSGCGTDASLGGEDEITMWGWDRAITDTLLAEAAKNIPVTSGKRLSLAKIGGNYNTKIRTALAGKSQVPDVIMINSDVATYFPNADQFHDLNELGADKLKDKYLEWKWNRGVTPDGKMLGFPMDTGPTCLFFRRDLYKKAKVPIDPAELAAEVPGWEDYFKLGRRIRRELPGSVLFPNINSVWTMVRTSQSKSFMTAEGTYIGDGEHIRLAWDLACRAHRDKISANARSTDQTAILTTGRQVSSVGAVWAGADLAADVPKTAGKWRVADPPGGPGNYGGSFMAVTKYAKDPQAAFKTIAWLQSTKNQVRNFVEVALFPADATALDSPKLDTPGKFYGGQHTIDVFGKVAEKVPEVFLSPYESIINTQFDLELPNVEGDTKSPERAWKDAQANVERELTRIGVI